MEFLMGGVTHHTLICCWWLKYFRYHYILSQIWHLARGSLFTYLGTYTTLKSVRHKDISSKEIIDWEHKVLRFKLLFTKCISFSKKAKTIKSNQILDSFQFLQTSRNTNQRGVVNHFWKLLFGYIFVQN